MAAESAKEGSLASLSHSCNSQITFMLSALELPVETSAVLTMAQAYAY